MKYATVIALLVLTLSLAATAQLARSNKLVTNIPFDFVARDKALPAGQCVLQPVTADGSVITIRNLAAHTAMLAMVTPGRDNTASGKYSLVFHQYGTRHFLSEIRTANGSVYKLPESKLEREMLAQNAASQEEILLASVE
jgi:hypothetical protein